MKFVLISKKFKIKFTNYVNRNSFNKFDGIVSFLLPLICKKMIVFMWPKKNIFLFAKSSEWYLMRQAKLFVLRFLGKAFSLCLWTPNDLSYEDIKIQSIYKGHVASLGRLKWSFGEELCWGISVIYCSTYLPKIPLAMKKRNLKKRLTLFFYSFMLLVIIKNIACWLGLET